MTTGRLLEVCTTVATQPRTRSTRTPSGINKGPVGAAVLTATGVEGDQVLDTRHHGGVDKAVYAYAEEDASWWAAELGEPVPPGRFGENLRVEGIDLLGAVIGERWRVGSEVELEVSEPRVPCATFQHHMGDRSGWVRRFTQVGRTGSYLRVLVGGQVAAGDEVAVTSRPSHGVTVGGWFARSEPSDARALVAAESDGWRMGTALRAHVDDVLARDRRVH